MMAGEEAEEQDLEWQLRAATEAIREAVLRLLRAGEVHPQLIVLAVAQVTGELGASAALAGGEDAERRLGELAAVVRQAGREHHAAIRAEALPVAGNA
jgi:hypothetical protein